MPTGNPYVDDETIMVMGPVVDPKGGYGMAVMAVDSEEHLQQLIAADPANGLNTYEYYPPAQNIANVYLRAVFVPGKPAPTRYIFQDRLDHRALTYMVCPGPSIIYIPGKNSESCLLRSLYSNFLFDD